MNILISMVVSTYDEFMGQEIGYIYRYKVLLNLDVAMYKKTIRDLNQIDCLLVSSKIGE